MKRVTHNYSPIHGTDPPKSMTIDRFDDMDEVVLAQSTSMCLRKGCCRPSINWVLLDSSNFEPTTVMNPFDLPSVGGWIHEESTFFQRCLCSSPGCRETKFIHHSGLPPKSLGEEDRHCCRIQDKPTSSFLTHEEINQNIVAVHEKENTCGPAFCCCLPYLRTTDNEGRYMGETKYVCDECIFVPKFIILDKHGDPKFLLRPDTCCMGLCMVPRFGGRGGKCCRLPFLVRDPYTFQPKLSNTHEGKAQVTELWSGLVNEVCFKRHAYHVAFPSDATVEDKLVLIGSSILVDVAFFEQDSESK